MPGADRIRLTGIQVSARHGVYPQEKLTPQPFVIDVEAGLRPRPDLDDLATTVDYAALAQQVAEVATGEPVDLIETLAERIAAAVLAHPAVLTADVTVHKPAAPMPVRVVDVAVSITRRNPA